VNQWIKNIAVSGMLAVLLVSTIGVSIHTLYCFCKNELEYSLFATETEDHCSKSAEAVTLPPCCQKIAAQKSCCAAEKCAEDDHTKKPCTKKGTVYVKLNVDYLIPGTDLVDLHPFGFDFLPPCSIPQIIFFQNNAFEDQTLLSTASERGPPPKLFGRSLRIFVQSFLC
jgi:hypothetical protein